ncbi:MAG TPA: hypothetical protein VEW03_05335 [Longimicrobiaceae bacterium]|nr:hypothetical protein [Longimicrobiaceae bacterium]
MPLVPFEHFAILTPLPAEEVAARLASQVEPRRWLRFRRGPCAFEGEVDAAGFRIQRIIGYRNSFLPRIRGVISPTATGSRVDCTLTLHPFVIAFMAVWFGAFMLTPTPPGQSPWFRLVPVAMLLFGWVLATVHFAYEARRAKEVLAELLGPGESGVCGLARRAGAR